MGVDTGDVRCFTEQEIHQNHDEMSRIGYVALVCTRRLSGWRGLLVGKLAYLRKTDSYWTSVKHWS